MLPYTTHTKRCVLGVVPQRRLAPWTLLDTYWASKHAAAVHDAVSGVAARHSGRSWSTSPADEVETGECQRPWAW